MQGTALEKIGVRKARASFKALLNWVGAGERVVLTREDLKARKVRSPGEGIPIAAIVPLSDLERLSKYEQLLGLIEAAAAGETVPLLRKGVAIAAIVPLER